MSKARVGATLMVISLAAFALNCGVAATAPGIRLDVGSNPDPGTPSNPSALSDTFADLQLDSHWSGYVLLPPAYSICGTCQPDGPEGSWFIQQGISSPSLSGSSMQFGLGPHSVKYADILWNNKFTKRWQMRSPSPIITNLRTRCTSTVRISRNRRHWSLTSISFLMACHSSGDTNAASRAATNGTPGIM